MIHSKIKKIIKIILIFLSLIILGYFFLIFFSNNMAKNSASFIYEKIEKVPSKDAALILGTSKYLFNGTRNYFYKYRIDAAIELFKANKIKAILVSGDNSSKRYNEPSMMRADLVKAGIPSKYITLDHAGFRTLDSIVRADTIFDLKDYILVSQKFHLERAIYIAKAKGQNVIGYVAKNISNKEWIKRMERRELLARIKAFLDIYILKKEPKFYGKKVKVNYKSIDQ